MNDKLYIPRQIVDNLNISDWGVCAATTLLTYVRNSGECEIVSIKGSAQWICGDKDRKFIDGIKAGIKELQKFKYIDVIWNDSDVYIVDLRRLAESSSGNYVFLQSYELKDIFRVKERGINDATLLRCCLSIFGHFNVTKNINKEYKGKVCTLSQEILSNIFGRDVRTLRRYIKALEENNIIYVVRSGGNPVTINDNGARFNNFMSRYSDRSVCEKFAEDKIGNNVGSYSGVANNNRKYKQIYNQLVKGNYDYEAGIIDEVKCYIEKLNDGGGEFSMEPFEDYYLTI